MGRDSNREIWTEEAEKDKNLMLGIWTSSETINTLISARRAWINARMRWVYVDDWDGEHDPQKPAPTPTAPATCSLTMPFNGNEDCSIEALQNHKPTIQRRHWTTLT